MLNRRKPYLVALGATGALVGLLAIQGQTKSSQEIAVVAAEPPPESSSALAQETEPDSPALDNDEKTLPDPLQVHVPALGFDVDPPAGYKSTDEPANGKMVKDGVGVRLYFNKSAQTKVGVSVHADADFEQWFEDFAANEGAVSAVKLLPGSLGTWELVGDERGDINWRHLVFQASDGSYISINGWRLEDFEDLYDFASRIFDSPGSLEPIVVREQGELEG